MSKLLEGGVKVLSGPYGTVLEEMEAVTGVKGLHKANNVLQGGLFRKSNLKIARDYLLAGADVATTNTFGARSLLRDGEPELYRDVINAHVDLVLEAMEGTHGKNLVVPFGPFGHCYQPEEAPADHYEAMNFHEEQLSVVRNLVGLGLIDAVVFETICTGREGLGAVLAAQKMGIPVIPSFVVDKDARLFSGENLADVMKEIDVISRGYPLGFSINCCPIEGAEKALRHSNGKRDRLLMLYPNASSEDPRKLEEVDGVVHLHDHAGTAFQLVNMTVKNNNIKIIGGCCGFDHKAIHSLAGALGREPMDEWDALQGLRQHSLH